MSDPLTAKITAAVDEAERVALAGRPPPVVDGDDYYDAYDYDRHSLHEARCGYAMGEYQDPCQCQGPEFVLRHVKHAQDMLARHYPYGDGDGAVPGDDDGAVSCGWDFHHGCGHPWPCPTITSLAAAWDVH